MSKFTKTQVNAAVNQIIKGEAASAQLAANLINHFHEHNNGSLTFHAVAKLKEAGKTRVASRIVELVQATCWVNVEKGANTKASEKSKTAKLEKKFIVLTELEEGVFWPTKAPAVKKTVAEKLAKKTKDTEAALVALIKAGVDIGQLVASAKAKSELVAGEKENKAAKA